MAEWVGAINGARTMLAHLRDRGTSVSASERSVDGVDTALQATAGESVPEAVRLWLRAKAGGEAAEVELVSVLQKRIAEEFDIPGIEEDVEAVIEVGDRCAEIMCGDLDDVASASGTARDGFKFYLSTYHKHMFAHLGGYFCDAESLSPHDALRLLCWVQGYHSQLASLGVDATLLSPSLADAARDLMGSSAACMASLLQGVNDAQAFSIALPIATTESGKLDEEAMMPSSGGGGGGRIGLATPQFPVHGDVIGFLHAAGEGLASGPLSEFLEALLPELRPAIGSVHSRLLAKCGEGGASGGGGGGGGSGGGSKSSAAGAIELLSTALNSLHALIEELGSLQTGASPPLERESAAQLEGMRAEVSAVLSACAARLVLHLVASPPVLAAAHPTKLFRGGGDGGGGGGGLQALIAAVAAEVRCFASSSAMELAAALDREARVATTRLYLRQFLTSTAKLGSSAAESLAQDTEVLGAWCSQAPPPQRPPPAAPPPPGNPFGPSNPFAVDVSEAEGEAEGAEEGAEEGPGSSLGSAEILALESLRLLLLADADAFLDCWKEVLRRHPDAPPSVAEGVLQRRAELSKAKGELSKACVRAHSSVQAEATAKWAKSGAVGERPGAAEGAFSAAISADRGGGAPSTAKKGGGWFGAKQ